MRMHARTHLHDVTHADVGPRAVSEGGTLDAVGGLVVDGLVGAMAEVVFVRLEVNKYGKSKETKQK